MAELPNKIFSHGLAVAALLFLGLPAPAVAGGPGCSKGKADLQEVCSRKGQVVLHVPAEWDCEVREFVDGIVVRDRAGDCILEFLRSPAVMTAAEAARLYESLYLGESRLEETCAREIASKLTWGEEHVLGEYRPRARGRTVQAIYAVADGEVFVGLLKCGHGSDKAADWAVATAIFRSYRKPLSTSYRWRTRGGLFGPLYFFAKIPFNQFQNPD